MVTRAQDHDAAVSQVAEALSRLEAGWKILVAPRFGLQQPDAVALHPEHGVCIIVVTTLRAGEAERSPDGLLNLPDRPDRRLLEQPQLAAERIRRRLVDEHYLDLGDEGDPADAVRHVVIAPRLSDAEARSLFVARGGSAAEAAVTVWGSGFDEAIDAVVMGSRASGSAGGPTPVDPNGLHRLAATAMLGPAQVPSPPQVAEIQSAAAPLVADPTGSRLRRVRGPGGSGKTFAVTTRAAELARAGRRVLVLSFTTTLADRLRRLTVERCAERAADARLVTITNFHALCEHVVDLAESIGYTSVWPEGARWPVAIVDRARQVVEQGYDHRFDAIVIDEGQDFSLEWWEMLRDNFAAADAEFMVTADPNQDLYRVEPWFDDETMAALGFVDPWVELPHVVRTPPDLVPAVDVVAIDPVDPLQDGSARPPRRATAVSSPERDRLLGPPVPSVLRWVDIDRVAELGRQIGQEVVRLVRDHPTLVPGDVTFVCDYHHDGLAAVREIERAGIPVHHQFSRDPAGRSVRRRRFWVGSSAVKGATVHGFKGWESSALVMGIGADATSVALASIAIERAGSPGAGGQSIVTIVNGNRSRRAGGEALSRTISAEASSEFGEDVDAWPPTEPDAPMPTPAPAMPTPTPTPAMPTPAPAMPTPAPAMPTPAPAARSAGAATALLAPPAPTPVAPSSNAMPAPALRPPTPPSGPASTAPGSGAALPAPNTAGSLPPPPPPPPC